MTATDVFKCLIFKGLFFQHWPGCEAVWIGQGPSKSHAWRQRRRLLITASWLGRRRLVRRLVRRALFKQAECLVHDFRHKSQLYVASSAYQSVVGAGQCGGGRRKNDVVAVAVPA